MNRERIRQQFRQYRWRITELEERLDEQAVIYEAEAGRLESRVRACRQQAESDRWYKEAQMQAITREFERARAYGDDRGESRAIEKLKRL